MNERDFDVVVFGATGVTGRRVSEYLAEQGARWAPAARDSGKLERILAEDGVTAPETLVAHCDDPGSLARMAGRTKVVLDLVGPYTLYGRPVIEACVANGAHYVDLTGEIPFVRKIIDEVDLRAREAQVKIVQVCGFEALPPDLAVLLASETARDRFGEGLAEADVHVTITGPPGMPRPSDLLSGGTLQSLAAVTSSDDASAVTDPAALITDPVLAEEIRRRSPITVEPRRAGDAVIAPMAPAAYINPAVIQRTACLTGSEPLRYREGMALRGNPASLPLRYIGAGMMSGMQAVVAATTRARPRVRQRVGDMLSSILPSSGFGPSADRLDAWQWQMAIAGRTTGGHSVHVDIDAEGHPGYLATSRIIGETGLLLAEDGLTPDRAGCLTPASALGIGSVDRFERARVRFSVAA